MPDKPNELDAVALIELDGKAIGMAVVDGPIGHAQQNLADWPDNAIVRLMERAKAIARFKAEY